ncbi:TraR/DksA C4-type zinc finger protein [Candidatus Parcubacteria bacterium]|nr:TraR/DksA C4-type zinc finger protein [Candidatus Parcubacteria bacterium]
MAYVIGGVSMQLVQMLSGGSNGVGTRGDSGDQARMAHDTDVQIHVRSVLSPDQSEAGIKQYRNKEGQIVCRECRKPIEPKRLEALPHVLYCIPCKEQHEGPPQRVPKRGLFPPVRR